KRETLGSSRQTSQFRLRPIVISGFVRLTSPTPGIVFSGTRRADVVIGYFLPESGHPKSFRDLGTAGTVRGRSRHRLPHSGSEPRTISAPPNWTSWCSWESGSLGISRQDFAGQSVRDRNAWQWRPSRGCPFPRTDAAA